MNFLPKLGFYGRVSEFQQQKLRRPRMIKISATPKPTGPLRIDTALQLGSMVRRRRREQSRRIDDAAALSGVSVDLLSRLENGKGSVRLDKLLTVLDGLGLALVVAPKDHPWMQSVTRLSAGDAERP